VSPALVFRPAPRCRGCNREGMAECLLCLALRWDARAAEAVRWFDEQQRAERARGSK
jgi:hypothetical protein